MALTVCCVDGMACAALGRCEQSNITMTACFQRLLSEAVKVPVIRGADALGYG